MKDEDQQPSEEELREAAALAEALESAPETGPATAFGAPPPDALEAASLLRHARTPIAVPPAAALAARICQIADRQPAGSAASAHCADGKARCKTAIERAQARGCPKKE